MAAAGCLVQREVVDARGQPVSRLSAEVCLVHVIFRDEGRVRALPDGRVLFSSVEVRFPQPQATSWKIERAFIFDPAHADVAPAPLWPKSVSDAGLGFYDLSPDRTGLLYGTAQGDMWQITLASDRRQVLPLGLHRDQYARRDLPLAIWSGPDAIVYGRVVDDTLRLIRRRAGSETVLNAGWPRPARRLGGAPR